MLLYFSKNIVEVTKVLNVYNIVIYKKSIRNTTKELMAFSFEPVAYREEIKDCIASCLSASIVAVFKDLYKDECNASDFEELETHLYFAIKHFIECNV